jgi:hypothetical protein
MTVCAASSCRPIRGAHLPGCDSDCPGCIPQQAAHPEAVCARCRLDTIAGLAELALPNLYDAVHMATGRRDVAGRQLPSLYDALLDPTRVRSSGGPQTGPEDDDGINHPGALKATPATIPGDNLDLRRSITRLFADWTALLDDHDGRGRYRTPMPTDPGLPARARHLIAHLPRIAIHPSDIGPLTDQTRDLTRRARAKAYPQPPAGTLLGTCPLPTEDQPDHPCGGQVRTTELEPDGEGDARCRTCGTKATIAWWRERLGAQAPEWLPLAQLRHHLLIAHGLQVPDPTIWSWARTEQRLPTEGEGKAVRYHVPTAVTLAGTRRPYARRVS